LPNDKNGKCMSFVIVGDEAFALSEHVLWPYLNRNLSIQKPIYDSRLTRACRIMEYAFGILANNVEDFSQIVRCCRCPGSTTHRKIIWLVK
jgi:hypothetical protein